MRRAAQFFGIAASVVFLLSGRAEAATILVSDTFDWAGVGAGSTFTEVNPPSWTHSLTFIPPASSFNYAELDLRHVGNRANDNELWLISSQTNVFIGNLSESDNSSSLSSAEIDTFVIPPSLYPLFSTGSWALALKLGESSTRRSDNEITLDYATLRVSYESALTGGGTPAPEPASMALVGLAAGALAIVRRRRTV